MLTKRFNDQCRKHWPHFCQICSPMTNISAVYTILHEKFSIGLQCFNWCTSLELRLFHLNDSYKCKWILQYKYKVKNIFSAACSTCNVLLVGQRIMTSLDCMVADQLVSNEESSISTTTLTVNIQIWDISGLYVLLLRRSILYIREITYIWNHMIAIFQYQMGYNLFFLRFKFSRADASFQ